MGTGAACASFSYFLWAVCLIWCVANHRNASGWSESLAGLSWPFGPLVVELWSGLGCWVLISANMLMGFRLAACWSYHGRCFWALDIWQMGLCGFFSSALGWMLDFSAGWLVEAGRLMRFLSHTHWVCAVLICS